MKDNREHSCAIKLPVRHAPPETMHGAQRAAFRSLVLWRPYKYEIKVFISPNKSRVSYIAPDTERPDPLEEELKDMDVDSMIKLVVGKRIRPLTGNLSFGYVDNPDEADVRIGFTGRDGGSWSFVGNVSKNEGRDEEFSMSFGWLNATVIMHEFCHCLGMIHEHQNPLGKGIPWDEEKLYAEAKEKWNWSREDVQNNYLNTAAANSVNASDFDGRSIMLYPYPSHLTKDGSSQQMNARLSRKDVEWIWKMYNAGNQARPDMHRKFYPDEYEGAESPGSPAPEGGSKDCTKPRRVHAATPSCCSMLLLVSIILCLLLISCAKDKQQAVSLTNGRWPI